MSTNIQSASQLLAPGALVVLFDVDLNPIGTNMVLRFTNNRDPVTGGNVLWDGNEYVPVDCEYEGFEWITNGPTPQPKIRVSNANKVFSSAVLSYGDLVGAKCTRTRTFAQYLDAGSTPDPTAIYKQDIYVIDMKSAHNKVFIEWTLAAAVDQQGVMIPGRQVLQSACLQRYRVWNPATNSFDYSKATCPYAGAAYFDVNNNPCAAAQDSCSKQLSGCKLRFGAGGVLPTWAFPGVNVQFSA